MNTADGASRGRSSRRLSAEEQALWKAATRAVEPIRRKRPSKAAEKTASPEPEPVPTPPGPAPQKTVRQSPPPASPKPALPPLAGIERRLRQRVGRGAAAIDARLDLHGHTQERAYRVLLGFLHAAQANEAKVVLVITGKGARTDAAPLSGERGVLKRLVPQWLGLPEFRRYVIGFDAAHVSHGGQGALYVRVRRAR